MGGKSRGLGKEENAEKQLKVSLATAATCFPAERERVEEEETNKTLTQSRNFQLHLLTFFFLFILFLLNEFQSSTRHDKRKARHVSSSNLRY